MPKLLQHFSVLMCLLLWAQSSYASANNNPKLHKLLDDIWQYELTQYPSLARSEGKDASELPQQFSSISQSALKARHEKFESFMTQLDQINTSALNDEDSISLFMQKYRLNNYLSEYTYQAYMVPITSEYGFHSSIGTQLSGTTLKSKQDVQAYKQALSELPALFAQYTTYMREAIAKNYTQPKVVLQGYEDTISAFVNNKIEEHPFYLPVIKSNSDVLSKNEKETLYILVEGANKAFSDFYAFFTNEYRPNAKDDIAAKNWPNGEALYNNRIKHYTTTNMSAKEIHELGLQEVARIRAQMQTIVDELEFDGDINAFIEFLRTDERFYAKTPKDLIMYASYVAKQMDAKLPKLFYTLPRTPYGVDPVPDSIAPKYTTGRYISSNSSDEPGYYWVNTYALDKRPLYAIPALTLHEAVPGHHLQISLAAEMQNLPKVRRNTYISAFGEGWGLYSEYLGLEVGIYDDPYDDFGRLSYEMWRACRLVVDTGMHMFDWSRDKALAYMMENTALSEHNVRTEIDRYISWPAQALSYKIGEIKIKALRKQAETALGDKFDLRAFHDAVLENGSIPLFVLEQRIETFIENSLIE
jgi:uncharacterized protein (DUF885 family)